MDRRPHCSDTGRLPSGDRAGKDSHHGVEGDSEGAEEGGPGRVTVLRGKGQFEGDVRRIVRTVDDPIDALDTSVDRYTELARLEMPTGEQIQDQQRHLLEIIAQLDRFLLRAGAVLSGYHEFVPERDRAVKALLGYLGAPKKHSYDTVLYRIRRICREEMVPHERPIVGGEPGHVVRSMEIYSVMIDILISRLLPAYRPVFKKENGERINFLRFFLSQWAYEMLRWISQKGRDFFCWGVPVTPDPDEEEDPRWLERLVEKEPAPDCGEEEETARLRQCAPWCFLNIEQFEVLYARQVERKSERQVAECHKMDVRQVRELCKNARRTIAAALARADKLERSKQAAAV